MLGKAPLSTFDDGTDVGRACANLYPQNRDALLRSHLWNCAVKRIQLTAMSPAPSFEFTNAYPLPGDWLRTIWLGRSGNGVNTEFRQEGRIILTDAAACYLRYVWRNEVEGSYDALLIEVLTARMAWRLAYPVTKSTSLRDQLGAEYRLLLQQAKSIDAMEEPGDMVADDSPLIAVRY